jgi:S-adenosylmethionine synthetase
MTIVVGTLDKPLPEDAPVEIVERKGLGHPDTICDALAEALSLRLCRFYLDRCGMIMHHNVDKALLRRGQANPRFGGGEVLAPIEIYLAGRATAAVGDAQVPIAELAAEVCHDWVAANLRHLDPKKHLRVHSLIRPGAAELVELFMRQQEAGRWLANDTSCGAGFAPLSPLERAVLAVERTLNGSMFKAELPAAGEDVKVMGLRKGDELELTVACAIVDKHTPDLAAYHAHKKAIAQAAREAAAAQLGAEPAVAVNTADDPEGAGLYLTVTGTSAEAGDDGEAGRGNRANGLITPYRPMTMESVAGKNPVTHVGKLYNVAAHRIAAALVEDIEEVMAAEVYMVSRIGYPVTDPRAVDVRLGTVGRTLSRGVQERAAALVAKQVAGLDQLWRQLVAEEAARV